MPYNQHNQTKIPAPAPAPAPVADGHCEWTKTCTYTGGWGPYSSNFGLIPLVVVAVILLDIYMKIQVGKARKKYGVRYPDLYAVEGMKKRSGDNMDSGHEDASGVVSESDAFMFNCIQRVHQNQCENVPIFLGLLLMAGSAFPLYSGISGFVWVLGRFAYAQGYYTGDPSKRNRGAFSYLGLFALLGMTLGFAVNVFEKKKP